MIALMLLALCTAPAVAQDTAVEREARVRAWAARPVEHDAELAAALAAEDWTLRFLVVDALSRTSIHDARTLEHVARGLSDEHANVRTAALLALGRVAPGAPATDDRALLEGTARSDPRALGPEEALALLSCLRLRADDLADPPRLAEVFARATQHASARVADAARRGLWALGGEHAGTAVVEAQVAALLEDGRPSATRLLEAAPLLVRAGVQAGFAPLVRSALDDVSTGELGDERALVEGLVLRLGGDADRAALVRGWTLADETDVRMRFFDVVARVGDERLGAALLSAARDAPDAPDGPRAARLVASAADALPPGVLAREALTLPVELASEAWGVLAARDHDWTAAEVAPWLAAEHDDALRFDVARLAADTWLRRGGAARLGELLEPLVLDRDAGLRIAGFRWLCDGPGFARRVDALHRAWRELPLDARLERLRDLPRAAELGPFRDDLVALARDPATRTESVVELLGGFDDAAVTELLAGLLALELETLASARDGRAYRRIEARARVLARSLARAAPGRTGDLESAIAAQLAHPPSADEGGGRKWELSKTCVALLARTLAGRARLDTYLGREIPRRVRVEAALGLVERAPDVELLARDDLAVTLEQDYEHLDSTLRVRVLQALGRLEHADFEFLVGIAQEVGLPLELRLAALASLERLGHAGPLSSLLLRVVQHEVRLSTIEALGRLGRADVLSGFRKTFHERRPLTAMLPEDGDVALTLDRTLLKLGAYEPAYLVDVFARPRATARADLAARFRGARLPGPTFRWRAELELAGDLADAGRLRDALQAAGEWRALDARFLQALAERAARSDASRNVALLLFEAARIGLAGEAPVEGDAGRVERILLAELSLATALEDWDAFIPAADRLHARALVRSGRLRSLEEALGVTDARAGVDPLAQIASARWQARGWRALAGEDVDAARGFADRAARAVGASLRARRAQDLLEAALER